MRALSPVLIAGVAVALAATSAIGQRPDDQISPRSVELLRQGNAHLAAGKFIEADEAFETALAVDPRNRAAYNALAQWILVGPELGRHRRIDERNLL